MAITTKMLGSLGGVKKIELSGGQSTQVPSGDHIIAFEALATSNSTLNVNGRTTTLYSKGARGWDMATGPTTASITGGAARLYITRL